MYCTNCGTQSPEGAFFCGRCGTALAATQQAKDIVSPASPPIPKGMPIPPPTRSARPTKSMSTGTKWLTAALILTVVVLASFGLKLFAATQRDAAVTDTLPTTAQGYMSAANQMVTGRQLAGNPVRYTGAIVDLIGKVSNVLDATSFNLQTDDDAFILITTDDDKTLGLDVDERVRVLGHVVDPSQGSNAFGGHGNFATVRAAYVCTGQNLSPDVIGVCL